MDKLVNRLRGQYEIGEGAMYGKRDFSDFIPAISLEAATRIEDLEGVLNDLLNDCINFDGGKLTPVFMEAASNALKTQ